MKKTVNSEIASLFEGGGEMGERIMNYDWSKTSIGPITSWPQSLKTIVRIMMTSRQPIWIGWGPELIKLYNDPYKAIAGGKHPDALGKPASVVWADIWKDIEPMLKQVMEKNEGTFVESQLLIMERNGFPEETYYTFSYNPVPAGDGTVGGMFCSNSDDTQFVIGERQLNLLRSLAAYGTNSNTLNNTCELILKSFEENPKDVTRAALYLKNEKTNILHLIQQSGFSEDGIMLPEWVGEKTVSNWPLFEALKTSHPILQSINSKKKQKSVVLSFGQQGDKDGVLVLGLNEFRQFDHSYKSFLSLVAAQVAANITNAQKYEDEKKRILALEEIDKAKTVFFSNVSHEFRTPITLMLGPLEGAMNNLSVENDPALKQTIETAHRNAMRLLKLVNGLLDFSRIESGRQKASFVLEDLVQFTKQLASNFQSVIEKAGLQFIVKADTFIQPIYIDKEMWEKIVFNLLSNAFKFTLSGSITVSITAEEKYAVLKVSDTGVGIANEELPNLFQRFHRINNSQSRTFEGTGIGLSMIKELVKQLGGEILVKSEINQGSTFEVRVPFGKSHIPVDQFGENKKDAEYLVTNSFVEEAKGILGDELAEEFEKTEGSGDLILVVDDNADMRQHLKKLLIKNYRIETAANGMEALHKVRENPPALILSDYMMPILNGAGLLREIKSNPKTKNIPLMLLTARAGEESKIEGFEMGADDYLVKPFSSNELLSRIKTQLKVSALKKMAERHIYDVFDQAPVAIAIFSGRDLICEFANTDYLALVNKQKANFIGQPLFDALPETKDLLYPIAMRLLDSGEPFPALEFEIALNRRGKDETCYFNSTWTPLRNEDGFVRGMIVCAQEITQLVANRQMIQAN